jgi:hypothetical protein
MKAFGVTQSGPGKSAAIEVEPPTAGTPRLSLICTISAGSILTYSVEVTGDSPASPGGNWNAHDVIAAQTDSTVSNVTYPVTAVRLNVTAYTSGSVHLAVVQSGL